MGLKKIWDRFLELINKSNMDNAPPNDLPLYRLLTGVDDRKFCERVSEALKIGYELYGSPAITFNSQTTMVAQAVIWKGLKK
jgi:hypothetical protein